MIHCPSCAAALRFDIKSQQMHCDHCGNFYNVEDIRDSEKDDSKSSKMYDTYVYTCPGCGGEILTTDKNDAVGFCPYCGGQSMLFDKVREQWKPKSVIPFMLDKEDCKKAYEKEVKKHIFVSGKYKDPELIDGFKGIYMPYWSSESEHKGKYVVKTKSREKRVGRNDYKTEYYDAVGEIDYQLNGYSHDASVAFDDHMSENLAPFDIQKEKDFHPGYLSGFYAEVGDADTREYLDRAKREIGKYVGTVVNDDSEVHRAIRKEHLHVDDEHDTTVPVNIKKVTSVMYPVWFMSYRKNDKITYAAVNGESGKVSADLPLSPVRILIAALILSAAVFSMLLLFQSSLPSLKAPSTLGVCAVIAVASVYYMLKSFVGTVCDAYSSAAITDNSGTGIMFFLEAALALTGVVMYTTDGSYEGDGRFFGMIMAIAGIASIGMSFINRFSQISDIKKKLKMKENHSTDTGVVIESMKALKGIIPVLVAVLITAALSILMAYFDFSNKYLCYFVCVVLAAEAFGFALLNIRFQANVAKRGIPQFNKKGAYYDKNK